MELNNNQNFFPVYDMLLEQVKSMPNCEVPLNSNNITELKNKIDNLDKVGKDMVYVLIRIHSLRFSNSKLLDVPYNGERILSNNNETSDNLYDITFDIKKFPNILSRMLIVFCDLHLRKIKEDTDKTK
jgi:hypothetical protein